MVAKTTFSSCSMSMILRSHISIETEKNGNIESLLASYYSFYSVLDPSEGDLGAKIQSTFST